VLGALVQPGPLTLTQLLGMNRDICCMQVVKRLAQTVINMHRGVGRLQGALNAFVSISHAQTPARFEAALAECLAVPLRLCSLRLFMVARNRHCAVAVGPGEGGRVLKTSWRAMTVEQPSIVAWCALRFARCTPRLQDVTNRSGCDERCGALCTIVDPYQQPCASLEVPL
jgi:hypothetical protein